MHKITTALVSVILILGQFYSHVAASELAQPGGEKCGNTYIVQPNDSLELIARKCDTTVSSILELNIQLQKDSLIYAGQVLRLTEIAPYNYLPTYAGYVTTAGSLRLSVSTVQARFAENIRVYISGFPGNTRVNYSIGKYGGVYDSVLNDVTDSEGNSSAIISLPHNANRGERWIIRVQTVNAPHQSRIYSRAILILGTPNTDLNYGSAKVSVSKSKAKPGEIITVKVSGFPPRSEIDYRVGRYGYDYTVIYDGLVDEDGNATGTITIPLSAVPDQIWIVHVQTTSQIVGVDVNSPQILIIKP